MAEGLPTVLVLSIWEMIDVRTSRRYRKSTAQEQWHT